MKFKRRKYLINAAFQMKVILTFVCVSLLGSFAAVATFNLLAIKKLEQLMWSIHIKNQSTGELLKPLFLQVNIISFLFVSILFVIAAVWMSRKASGPLYRMSKDIMNAARGDLTTEIKLRYKDEFADTAHDLDSMVKDLRGKFRDISDHYRGVSEVLPTLRQKEDSRPVLDKIEQIEKELQQFRTG